MMIIMETTAELIARARERIDGALRVQTKIARETWMVLALKDLDELGAKLNLDADRAMVSLPLDDVMAWRNRRFTWTRSTGDVAVDRLEAAIDAATWKPPAPVVITRVACADHPHPTDNTPYLGWNGAMSRQHMAFYKSTRLSPNITHWAPMPTWVDQ